MKTVAAWFIAFLITLPVLAQSAFSFDPGKTKVVIPFKLINNLIFITVEVNDVPLTFLLDSGIEETLLFSLEETDEISFANVEKIRLRGLGSADYVECLKSANNRLHVSGMSALNHTIYIVLDQDFNFSSNIGIPVNGIIGYHFFKNNLVKIDYDRQKIVIYKNRAPIIKKLANRYTVLPMNVELQKPYVLAEVQQQQQRFPAKLLVDTGSSDSVWLFDGKSDEVQMPQKSVDDYLGRGFSGDIHGRRGRITEFKLDKFSFEQPIAAFPDSGSLAKIKMVDNRIGSVGGEILRRFNVVFDYQNNRLYLKKGRHFEDPFQYNMSGIELHHDGLQWVEERVELSHSRIISTYDIDGKKERDYRYKFELKPVYCITNVRPNSPAEISGLQKGDIIVSINNTKAFHYTLQQITELLKSEEGKTIEIEVERNDKLLKCHFVLQSLL